MYIFSIETYMTHLTFKQFISEEVTTTQLKALEVYLDAIFASNNIDFKFTRHFLERVNDQRNGKPITVLELKDMFKKAQQQHGADFVRQGPDYEAVINDINTNINSPFVLNWNRRNQELELIAKTVMRKKNFKTSNDKFKV